jgi:hypothetical protein
VRDESQSETLGALPRILPGRWRKQAEDLRRYGADLQARVLEDAAEQLEEALRGAGDEGLSLPEAARQSGYSVRRLRQLVEAGVLPNAGKGISPRILRSHLPRRPGHGVAEGVEPGVLSRRQMARAVATGG